MLTSLDPTGRQLLCPPGVYVPQQDTRLLAAALCQEPVGPGTTVLDIGTGSGALALCAARRGAQVTAVDVAWRAVVAARLNVALARRRITVVRSDLTRRVRGRRYDVVLSNPPYVPAPGTPRGRARAWDAGPDGRAVVDRVCGAVPEVLAPGGVFLLAQSALIGTRQTLEQLTAAGLNVRIQHRARVPFGPVLLSRLPWLAARGLLDGGEGGRRTRPAGEGGTSSDGDGTWTEELVIIRAARP